MSIGLSELLPYIVISSQGGIKECSHIELRKSSKGNMGTLVHEAVLVLPGVAHFFDLH